MYLKSCYNRLTLVKFSIFQAFLVDIYARSPSTSDNDVPDHIGMCYIYPDNLKQTMGKLQTPITSMKFQPMGKLTGEPPLYDGMYKSIESFQSQLIIWWSTQLLSSRWISPSHTETTGPMPGKVWMLVTEGLATLTPRGISKYTCDRIFF